MRICTVPLRTALVAAVLGGAAMAGLAQATPGRPPEAVSAVPAEVPSLNGIAHVAVRVKDIAASVAFYKKLGFEQAFAMTKGDVVTQSFLKVNDRQFIELYPVTDQNTQVGFLHLCFEGANLNALHDFYVGEGLSAIPVRKAGAGNLLFTMKGPQQDAEPQNIEYTQYMPGSLHSNDFGKHLGTERVADKIVLVTLAMQDPGAARAFYADKLQFVQVSGGSRMAWRYGLPGSSGEGVEIVPVENLGAMSRITLTSPNTGRAEASLKAHGVAFTKANGALTVTDPDGNVLVITRAGEASGAH